MSCHVTHRTGLTSGVGRFLGRAGNLSGRGVGGESGLAGLGPFDLATRPGSDKIDRHAGTVVTGPRLLKEWQHMLGAVCRPDRKKVMIGVRQGTAPAHSYQPGIAFLAEYDSLSPWSINMAE